MIKRKLYKKPKLRRFGHMREITQGGSNGKSELNPDGSCNDGQSHRLAASGCS